MDNLSGAAFFRRDLPQLFNTQRVVLRIPAGIKLIIRDQLFAQMTAAAFGEQRIFRQQVHTRGKTGFFFPPGIDPHIAGGDAGDGAGIVIQDAGGGKTGENIYSHRFCLAGQPAAKIPQANDVITRVMHWGRDKSRRDLPRFFTIAQQQEFILRHRRVQRCAERRPVGEEFVERPGFEQCSGKNMRANLSPFFNDANAQLTLFLLRHLHQPAGCR